jgi:type IV secretory pathway VirB3-like protein
MKKLFRPAIILGVSVLIALFSAAITYTAKIASQGYSTTASLFLQTSPTPKVEEAPSEVGSTDGIIIMGAVITAIVLIPVLLQRKAWMREE